MKKELLPCPFCGSEAVMEYKDLVRCNNTIDCGVELVGDNVVEKWNTRKFTCKRCSNFSDRNDYCSQCSTYNHEGIIKKAIQENCICDTGQYEEGSCPVCEVYYSIFYPKKQGQLL